MIGALGTAAFMPSVSADAVCVEFTFMFATAGVSGLSLLDV